MKRTTDTHATAGHTPAAVDAAVAAVDLAGDLAALEQLVDDISTWDLEALPDPDLLPAVEALAGAQQRLAATEALLLDQAQLRQAYKAAGSARLVDWIKTHLRTDPIVAGKQRRLATQIANDLPATRDAWRAGNITTAAAETIATQMRDPRVEGDADFEAELVATARTQLPSVVRQTATAMKHKLDPPSADDIANRQHQRRRATWTALPGGMHKLEAITTARGRAKLDAGLRP
ncbi:MAG: DUF222 domain-containing protein [Actinobacteria bacterium]|nr:DUF222 domain-containing protein [Actinomycetota bacterium]